MRVHFHKIFVIDDLANRKHDCDVLLDQNYFSNQEKRYQNLISKDCHMFCGPRHTLLRKEFWNERQGFSRKNDISRENIGIIRRNRPKR
jgi:UDP-2,4-diacetamido-2,4,6-trideoxy-beta-L-altropyranose hydrolase